MKTKKTLALMNDIEKRSNNLEVTEMRANEDGSKVIEGYALKFNTFSKDLGGFIETIAKDALRNADFSNCIIRTNHDSNLIVGRYGVNLDLIVDEVGLKYRCVLPNTTKANDLYEEVSLGIIEKSSFAFRLSSEGDEWEQREDGAIVRTITEFSEIRDVSPVVDPAYEDTSVAKRTLEEVRKSWESAEDVEERKADEVEEVEPKPNLSADDQLRIYKLKLIK